MRRVLYKCGLVSFTRFKIKEVIFLLREISLLGNLVKSVKLNVPIDLKGQDNGRYIDYTSHMINNKITTYVDYNYCLKSLNTVSLKLTNQNLLDGPKVLERKNMKPWL